MVRSSSQGFWREAFALRGSITPHVLPTVMVVGLISTAICLVAWAAERSSGVRIGLEVAPYEIAGAALGLLLVLRTNAGYDRWWEARKLWGGIVNQSRNLAIGALAYGPAEHTWRASVVAWVAAFAHVSRASLRGERPDAKVAALVGAEAAASLEAADHMPSQVARVLAGLLREARDRGALDAYAFLQLDRERATLIDHLGGCERIVRTPLPRVYSIMIRGFIALFLLTLPLALLHQLEAEWLTPIITMLVAYPLVALDQIGIELQNPFATRNVGHLPLDEIAATIERNLRALLAAAEPRPPLPPA